MSVDITSYVQQLHADLHAAASAGGSEMAAASDRLSAALDAAVRMAMLEALSDAAAEITSELGDRTVEVRLRGREPQFAVSIAADPAAHEPDLADELPDDDGSTARITLRLSESLKQRAEESAARARQSMNAWLVDAIRDAVAEPRDRGSRRRRSSPQHLTGWAR